MRLTTCMLADGARVNAADSKLYVFGGRWDRIFTLTVPLRYPTMTIVLVLELEYTEALEDHLVEVVLNDADGRAVGPRAGAQIRVGHAPGMVKGEPIALPLAIEQQMVEFPDVGRYEWVVTYDGRVVGHLPITVGRPHNLPLGLNVPPPSAPAREDEA
jgi:hypothetical protein